MGDSWAWFRLHLGAFLVLAVGGVLGACAAEPVREVRTVFLPVSYDEAMAAVEEEPPRGTIGLKHCPSEGFESREFGPWNDAGRKAMAADNVARHQANDVVASVGRAVRVQARVSYGEEDVSLEGEWVRVYLGKCDGWRQVGYQRTGMDGVVSVLLAERLPAGVYEVAFQVVGDLSFVTARVWIVPANTPVVVFKVVGTLVAQGTEDLAEPLPGAVDLTRAYAARGYLVAYLAGNLADGEIRDWLVARGFSEGAVLANNGAGHHRLGVGEGARYEMAAAPDGLRSSVAEDFRVDTLNVIREAGLLIDAAYGSAAADAQAFGRAGLRSEQIWLMSGDSWEGHAEKVEILEPEM